MSSARVMSIASLGFGRMAVHCATDVTAPPQKRGSARRRKRIQASSTSPASIQCRSARSSSFVRSKYAAAARCSARQRSGRVRRSSARRNSRNKRWYRYADPPSIDSVSTWRRARSARSAATIGPAGDLVARRRFEDVEHRGREHEPEDVDGQPVDDLRVEVLRELVGGPTEAGDGAGLVMAVGEDARERNGGDQPFRTLEEVGAIGFVECHSQHFEQRRGLVGQQVQVVGRDLVEVARQPQPRDAREGGDGASDEEHVQRRRTVDAECVQLGERQGILEHVDAVADEHGLVAHARQAVGDRSIIGRSAGARERVEHSGSETTDVVVVLVEGEPYDGRRDRPGPLRDAGRLTAAGWPTDEGEARDQRRGDPRCELATTHLVPRWGGNVVRAWHRSRTTL